MTTELADACTSKRPSALEALRQTVSRATLPFTGLALGLFMVIGLMLTMLGLGVRNRVPVPC